MSPSFPALNGLSEIESPALLFIQERIESNLSRMLAMVDNQPQRLRPHVKTHKTPELIRLQVRAGITKFKAATLAEAELCASNGGTDVLVAYPLQGPAITHLLGLRSKYPQTVFSLVLDAPETLQQIETLSPQLRNAPLDVFLELDCGMGRTGISPGKPALRLYSTLSKNPLVHLRGVHVYDGHLHDTDLSVRSQKCHAAFEPVLEWIGCLETAGIPVPTLVAGGSPTFGLHARHHTRECSPGTTILWDFGYGDRYPDLPFECAAYVLTRIVSKPGNNRLCLDLGHKAIAPEMPQPRVRLQGLEDAPILMQNEEHLVVQVEHPEAFQIGDPLLGLPRHVCPTVSMYNQAIPFRSGCAGTAWKITARGRQYSP